MAAPSDTPDCRAALTLVARYAQLWDDRRYDDWVTLFSPDAEFDWRGKVVRGRDAIQKLIGAGNAARPQGPGVHVTTNPVAAELDGQVRVTTDFVYFAYTGERLEALFAGRSYDRLARRDGELSFVYRAVRFLGEEPPDGWR
jgi:3-phenylpropionate/cinnamic acid dioxygenase small subunit